MQIWCSAQRKVHSDVHLGWSGGEVILEDDLTLQVHKEIRIVFWEPRKTRICLVESPLPGCSLLPMDAILPEHQVHGSICILHWPEIKMITVEFYV